jgi:hypothetical protein
MLGAPLFRKVTELLNARKNRILLIAQVGMTEHQFTAFKKLFLDELGERGLESELKPLLSDKQHGMDRHGRE